VEGWSYGTMEYGMKRIVWVRGFVTVLLGALAASLGAAERPNVIVILADDLGWADLPSYGNRFHETPALDRLAAEGMRFTQFYSGAVCSPTRSNLQSGRHEARYGITQHIPGHRRPFAKLIDPAVPLQLPLEVETLAERLGASGYATGYFGKWHLGGEGFGPAEQGWKTALEVQKHVVPPEVSGLKEPRRTAAFLTEKAVAFLEEHRDEPFLLQVSHYAVHIPLSTTPELLEKYRKKEKVPGFPCLPEYAGLLEELDASVGDIVTAVDRLGLAEKTMIVFVSDNGGLVHDQAGKIYTSNAPLRSEKGTLYEGGIRVPAIVRMPGFVPAGAVCEVPAVTTDLPATILELAGASLTGHEPLDGVSLLPLLRDPKAAFTRDTLFWHLPHYHHSSPASAIRKGDWKLIEFFEDGEVELYDLSSDVGESKNLAANRPDKTTELRGGLAEWRTKIGARLPVPNPDHDPARAGEMKGGKGKRGGTG
jgi:arylsulfatase A